MAIRRTTITVTGATGGAGAATATAVSTYPLDGEIVGVHLTYTGSAPVGTDTVIEEAHNSPAMPIVTETNYNTDGWLFPVHEVVSSDGTQITNGYQEIDVADYVRVTISEADDGSGVTAVVVWRESRGAG